MTSTRLPAGAARTGRRSSVAPARAGRATRPSELPYVDDTRSGTRAVGAIPGRRTKDFVTLFALVLGLCIVGLAMVLSASSVTSLERTGSPWSQFARQGVWFGGALVALVVAMRVDYHRWQRWAAFAVLGSGLLLLAVMVPGLGQETNGAQRWLGYGSFSIQPSELAKLAMVLFIADLLARRARWIDDPRLTVVPILVALVPTLGLIMLQPNLGTTMIIFITAFAMMFVAGLPGVWLALLGAGAAFGGAAALVLSPWRTKRLMAFRDPFADPLGTGYQTAQSIIALANGKLAGTGLGQGRSKYGFLPEAHTDFIFSVIAEETGFMGALVVVALFVAFAVFGVRVALRAPDRFGMLLATGITAWFLVQAFMNIGQSVGALPVVGIPLPFVSSGGSSLVVNMLAAGMLLNVARHTT